MKERSVPGGGRQAARPPWKMKRKGKKIGTDSETWGGHLPTKNSACAQRGKKEKLPFAQKEKRGGPFHLSTQKIKIPETKKKKKEGKWWAKRD